MRSRNDARRALAYAPLGCGERVHEEKNGHGTDVPTIDMELTRQDLAELTGTTLYTVSRILSGWGERGLIASGRTRVVIRDPHGVVAIAEDLPAPRSTTEPPPD